MSQQTSQFIPNSFPFPNAYVDRLMAYLTGEEWKVLTYAARRIFGFQKRQDRISLGQLVRGIKTRDGEILDEGAGISKFGAQRALAELIRFNIVLQLDKGDPRTNTPALYALQLDAETVDWRALRARRAEWDAANAKKTANARKAPRKVPPISRGSEPNTPTADLGCGTDQVDPGLSHSQALGCGTDQPCTVAQEHNISGNTGKNSERQRKAARARDERLDHPAIILVRKCLRLYPPKAAWDTIIEVLGSTPDAEKFEKVYTAWTLAGNKPTNLSGVLDWYKNGVPVYTNKRAPGAAAAPTEPHYWPDGTPVEA